MGVDCDSDKSTHELDERLGVVLTESTALSLPTGWFPEDSPLDTTYPGAKPGEPRRAWGARSP